jgi:hypothetical protein
MYNIFVIIFQIYLHNSKEEDILEDPVEVLHNNWMAEGQKGEISADDDEKMRELKLKMISRQEDVQVLRRCQTKTLRAACI